MNLSLGSTGIMCRDGSVSWAGVLLLCPRLVCTKTVENGRGC